jgi:hypothetical protein
METRHDTKGAKDRRQSARIMQMIAGLGWREIRNVLFAALLLALLTNAIYDAAAQVLENLFAKHADAPFPLTGDPKLRSLLTILVPSAVALWAVLRHHKAKSDQVGEEISPEASVNESRGAKVLVLFLSTPRGLPQDPQTLQAGANGNPNVPHSVLLDSARANKLFANPKGKITDKKWLAAPPIKETNWRMPLEAIGHQLSLKEVLLERVVIIPSADRHGEDGVLIHGSHYFDETFRDIAYSLIKQVGHKVNVERVADAVSPKVTYKSGKNDIEIDLVKGVPFHDIEAIYATLSSLMQTLALSGVKPSDVLIDATGGLVPTSIAAAVFTILSAQRRIQYVDTGSFKVLTYNVTHDAADLALPL